MSKDFEQDYVPINESRESQLGMMNSSNSNPSDIIKTKKNDSRAGFGTEKKKKIEDVIATGIFTETEKQTILKLKVFQEDHIKLEEEYRKEWNQLKQKYLKKFQPFYQSRKNILTTKPDITPKGDEPVSGTPSISNFWLKAMLNHTLLAEMIEAHDHPILSYLTDIYFEWFNSVGQSCFKLYFYFAQNEYFKNDVLVKTYWMEREDDESNESFLTRTEGTTIEWYPDKNVTEKTITRKQRNKRTQQTRTITEVVESYSFFNFFRSHDVPDEEKLNTMESSYITELDMVIEAEYEIGCIIRDRLVPRALGWYLGIEKDEETESACESQDENEEEEDEDDEDDDKDSSYESNPDDSEEYNDSEGNARQ